VHFVSNREKLVSLGNNAFWTLHTFNEDLTCVDVTMDVIYLYTSTNSINGTLTHYTFIVPPTTSPVRAAIALFNSSPPKQALNPGNWGKFKQSIEYSNYLVSYDFTD
jgi:hypothetical protein